MINRNMEAEMIVNSDRLAEVTGGDFSKYPKYFSMKGRSPQSERKAKYKKQFQCTKSVLSRDYLKNETCGWFDPLLNDGDAPKVSDEALVEMMHNFIVHQSIQFDGLDFEAVDLNAPRFTRSFSEWRSQAHIRHWINGRCIAAGLRQGVFDTLDDHLTSTLVPRFKLPWAKGFRVPEQYWCNLVDFLVKNRDKLDLLCVSSNVCAAAREAGRVFREAGYPLTPYKKP